MSTIIKAPNQVLSEVSTKVGGNPPKVDSRILADIAKTLENAADPKGVGLAAPQIGLSLSFFITKSTDKSKVQVFINPEILEAEDKPKQKKGKSGKKKKNKKLEGCLSLPNIWGAVKRADEVVVSYYDEQGGYHKKRFKGFMAIIIQHEIDHLNGILFPKRVLEQKGKLYQSSKNKKGELVFDPIEL